MRSISVHSDVLEQVYLGTYLPPFRQVGTSPLHLRTQCMLFRSPCNICQAQSRTNKGLPTPAQNLSRREELIAIVDETDWDLHRLLLPRPDLFRPRLASHVMTTTTKTKKTSLQSNSLFFTSLTCVTTTRTRTTTTSPTRTKTRTRIKNELLLKDFGLKIDQSRFCLRIGF